MFINNKHVISKQYKIRFFLKNYLNNIIFIMKLTKKNVKQYVHGKN